MAVKKQIIARFAVVYMLLLIAFVAVFVRILHIQYVEGNEWKSLGDRVMKREDIIDEPTRGNIYSSDGKLLASSMPLYRLRIDFQAGGFNKDTLFYYLDDLSVSLSKKLKDKSPSEYKRHILNGYNKKSRSYLLSSKEVSYLDLKEIQQFPYINKGRNKSGVFTEDRLERIKPFGSLASRTIGDIYGVSKKGRFGIEKAYDSYLEGTPGVFTRRKIAGKWMKINQVESIDGLDVVMTIDVDIQDIVEKELRHHVEMLDAQKACVVLMETRTGQIKAISNLSRVSPGVYNETYNMAVADEVDPGSTFKVVSMMIAMEHGVVDTNTVVSTGVGIKKFADREMRDHDYGREKKVIPDKITAAEAIYYSSNIGVAEIINSNYKNKPEKFVNAIYDMGLVDSLDLEIPGYGTSKIRHPKDVGKWYETTLPWMSIGYETAVPPIYTLTFFNAIANNGEMVKPYFVQRISRNGEVIKAFEPQLINSKICSPKTLGKIRDMLEGVVTKGTANEANTSNFKIAGKTGTAQVSENGRYQKNRHRYTFCGYFPAEAPLYSCMVYICEPRNGGGRAPLLFKRIAEKVYATSHNIVPDYKENNHYFFPTSKDGYASDLETVFTRLNIPVKGENKHGWMKTHAGNESIAVNAYELPERVVPNVMGMSAKDALFALGNAGLEVELAGKGRVVSQSLSANTYYRKGDVITITLK